MNTKILLAKPKETWLTEDQKHINRTVRQFRESKANILYFFYNIAIYFIMFLQMS